ncbi:MAG: hypothetical protein HN936_15425 [Bacteroidetes bacterium]|nr:hypothetical protein [Bacteroidota bacterium]MBT4411572.1 hypothetical protein [Bacteroidota bacterium]MBT7094638.1 hypothetical protein [Bacteroidota bacterium]MBT7465099.1 hypothetical protein [Bacteroidota bacterium]
MKILSFVFLLLVFILAHEKAFAQEESYRNWHYHPDLVIPPNPDIPGFDEVKMTDVPAVFQIPGDDLWYMSFIGFDGKGYQSFIAVSKDLIHWENYRLAMGYGPEGSFDYGGVVLGAYLYEDYDIKAPRVLKKGNGKFYSLYGAYPRQGGYELRPGYEGLAWSEDGIHWERAMDEPILSVYDDDRGEWEQSCIYQPWLVEHEGQYYNFYNAANGSIEQLGLAESTNLLEWTRFANNPVIPHGPKGSYNEKFSSDIKVFWDQDHWVGFFFGVGQGGAHIMIAYSDDLENWTVDPEPLYKAGGNPSGIDEKYAHKISLVWNPKNETFYMFYCAVDKDGNRGIGLITSKPLGKTDTELGLHSEGGPWNFYPAKEKQPGLKKVLLIGNSVMNGFHRYVINSLEGIADVDYWLSPKHLNSEFLFTDLKQVVSSKAYEVIQFNIGLHGWPEGRIKEEDYVPLLEKYVHTIKENAGDAELIWASITPVTEEGKAELNKDINPTITKRNGLADGVMSRFNVEVNDLYGLLANQLHLAKLDRFHWKSGGYQIMADQSVKHILQKLEDKKLKSYLNSYNVSWNSPSINSLGSMPAGNGDIGINLWVEDNGDLLFYISKTDAWSENARLLKIGKVRLSLFPNPFKSELPFSQVLVLQDGVIHIEAGEQEEKVAIDVWVDATNPVIELDIKSTLPLEARLSTEPWRTKTREITDKSEIHSAYGLKSAVVSRDIVLDSDPNSVIWAHRNERSIWESNMALQGLEGFLSTGEDPLINRTFGALIRSDQLQKNSASTLKNKNPSRALSASIIVHTEQTETLDDWMGEIQDIATGLKSSSRDKQRILHEAWWKAFWNRSYIHVSTQVESEKEEVFNLSRGYALQRYMNACSGRGNSPIKFNGSIFTVDTEDLQGKYHGFDADYRQWGGPYWWQNTRLPYWSMLESGDFDLMLPLFKMYNEALEVRKFATKKYYGHDGAFYPETMRHWGTYVEGNYGEDRSDLPLGMTQNRYIRYYWQGGLEISLMMLDYYAFTQDTQLLKETLLPVVKEVITFFDQHWERDENGKILFDPAMALETYNTAVNPLPEIVGITKVCTELLTLPAKYFSDKEIQQFSRLIEELPDIPMQEINGEKVLAPAEEYSGKQNIENPELYAIFPYRIFGMGKPDLELARRTFDNRLIKQTGGWQQNAIKAALLGLTDEAANLTAQNFNTSNPQFRFPVMWGPNYDWIPDQDHGSVALIALQRMLLQYDEDGLYIFQAWPSDWDVEFKLKAPKNTCIEGSFKNGEITSLKASPNEREKNIFLKKD